MWAHSLNAAGVRHALADHLYGTAELAGRFAAAFGARDAGYFLGLAHDAGKASVAGGRAWHVRRRPADGSVSTIRPWACTLTGSGITQAVLAAGHAAGIEGLRPHRLRHTFATRTSCQGGADPAQVQALLGHATLDTSARYFRAGSAETAAVRRRARLRPVDAPLYLRLGPRSGEHRLAGRPGRVA